MFPAGDFRQGQLSACVSSHECVQESRQGREGRDGGRIRAALPWEAMGPLIGEKVEGGQRIG